MNITRAILLAGVATASLHTAALAQSAGSGPAAQNDGATVDEVMVTARRREESLQDVPIAVSAFSEERLQQAAAQDITALQQITPNITVQTARGSNSTLIAFIRGVGQQDPVPPFEPGVGLYIDDVYVARPQGAVLDLYDVERVEVLRGPQGTLYGRNTIGGAIKYVTRKIGAEPTLRLRGQFGSYNQRDVIVSGSAPVGESGFSVSGAVAKFNRDGFGSNLFTGAEHYNRDMFAGRFSVEYAPDDRLFMRLAFEAVEDESNARHGHREVPALGLAGLLPRGEVLPSIYDTNAGLGDDNLVRTRGLSFMAQYALSDTVTLKSITAYRTGETRTNIDFDNTPAPALDVPALYDDDQFTQELQVLYEGDRMQGVVGVYYLDAQAGTSFDTILGQANLTVGSINSSTTKSLAVFGDLAYDITEQLAVSVGGRYTVDDKTGQIFRANYLGIRSPLLGGTAVLAPSGATPATRNPLTNYTGERTDKEFTPRVSVSYEFSPDLTAYASYSRGFKSGGFDPRGDARLTPQTVQGFEPETVNAFEIGLKGSLLDRRVTYAMAAFNNDYKDQQVTSQIPATPPAVGVASFVDNLGGSTIRGFEFEGTARLTDALTLVGAYGYIDAQIDEFRRFNLVTGVFENIASQVVVQNTPKHSANVAATYAVPMAGGTLSLTPSVSYRSAYSQFEFPNPALDQGGYTLVDFVAAYETLDGRYRASLQGRNLTDEVYRIGGYNFPAPLFGSTVIGFYGPPRTVSVVLEARF